MKIQQLTGDMSATGDYVINPNHTMCRPDTLMRLIGYLNGLHQWLGDNKGEGKKKAAPIEDIVRVEREADKTFRLIQNQMLY